MAREQQEHREDTSILRDDMTSTTATEDSPLLRSERSTSNPPSSRSSIGPDDEDLDVANQTVTKKRGIAIMLSVYVLIFLQGIVPSSLLRGWSFLPTQPSSARSRLILKTMKIQVLRADLIETTIFSHEHERHNNGPVHHRGGPGRVRERHVVHDVVPRGPVLHVAPDGQAGDHLLAAQHGARVLGAVRRRVSRHVPGPLLRRLHHRPRHHRPRRRRHMVLAFILVLELTTKRNRGLFIGIT